MHIEHEHIGKTPLFKIRHLQFLPDLNPKTIEESEAAKPETVPMSYVLRYTHPENKEEV